MKKWITSVKEHPIENKKVSTKLFEIANEIKKLQIFYADQIGFHRNEESSNFVLHFLKLLKDDRKQSTTLIIGDAGIGKSSFIKWFKEEFELNETLIRIDIYKDTYLESEEKTKTVFKECCKLLKTHFNHNEILNDFEIRCSELFTSAGITTQVEAKEFIRGFKIQNDKFLNEYPDFDSIYLFTTLISTINYVWKKPIWIFIDNVDLANKTTQEKFMQCAYTIKESIATIADQFGWKCNFHVILTIRPETEMRFKGLFSEFDEQIYLTPDVLGIFINKFKEVIKRKKIFTTALKIGDINVTQRKIINCLSFNDWRYELNPVNFHIHLVHRNVRRFMNFWCEILSSQNFIDFLNIPKSSKYLQLLMKGQYNFFPGNEKIDGIGAHQGSPLFFNIFGLEFNHKYNEEDYFNAYFIYVRILEYLNNCPNKTICYSDLKTDLVEFFKNEDLCEAVQCLLWVGIIDEIELGIRNVFEKSSFKEIILKDEAKISFSEVSNLYLNFLLLNYEYILMMATTSWQKENKYNEVISDIDKGIETGKIILSFMESWKDILKENIKRYSLRKITKFKQLFHDNLGIDMWKNTVNSIIIRLDKEFPDNSYLPDIEKIRNEFDVLLKNGDREFGTAIRNQSH